MTLVATPTTFTIGKIEQESSNFVSFNIATTTNYQGLVIASNNSNILQLKVRNSETDYSNTITVNMDNNNIDISVKITNGTIQNNIVNTLSILHYELIPYPHIIETVTFTYDVFETLVNYSNVYGNTIYCRDGVFSANTVKIGTSSLSMAERGDQLVFKPAAGDEYSIGKATQLDDGRTIPTTLITIVKDDNSILIKNNDVNTILITSDGSIRVKNNVTISSDVLIESENDWKLQRGGIASEIVLYKRINDVWEKRVGFT